MISAKAGIAHEYEEFPGGHEWPCWIGHLRDILRFFNPTCMINGGRYFVAASADRAAPSSYAYF